MDDIGTSFNEAVTLHEASRLPDAERLYLAVLQASPEHVGALRYLGALRAQQGQHGEAMALLHQALRQDPQSAETHNLAGSVLQAMARPEAAVGSFDRAIALDPGYAEAHYNRGTALQALGRHQAAIDAYEAALAIEPEIPEADYNVGTALQALGRDDAAIIHYEHALAIHPGYAKARVALGAALQLLGRHQEAIACYEKALALDPANADLHTNLGLALHATNRARQAIAHHERALAIRPGFGAAHNNLGLALQALDRHDEAITQYRQAIAAEPRHVLRQVNFGVALQEIGRIKEAAGAFEKAIELMPRSGRLYRHLADCRRFAAGEPALVAMQRLATDRASLPEEDRRQLLFALAKASADLGEYPRAFDYMLEGNALKRQQTGADEVPLLAEFAHIRAVFDPVLMQRRGGGEPSPMPVFVVGMPRSGTTLIEQILASHKQVFGAGELNDIADLASRLIRPDATAQPFPESVSALSDQALRQFGARYVAAAKARAPNAHRFTDKMPFNFLHLGLINLALPNARIIHVRRDPIDTCFSCFATLFTGSHRIVYDLAALGRYYRAYERLMAHWRLVLPSGVLLEVQYEELVADIEPQARRIVAHCGLDWDQACLEFHQTRRPVRTASVAQVREPIHTSSIGRWRPYGNLLRPLFDALGTAGPGDERRDP